MEGIKQQKQANLTNKGAYMPVGPATPKTDAEIILQPEIGNQPGQHSKTPGSKYIHTHVRAYI